jgi:hypothetical protein
MVVAVQFTRDVGRGDRMRAATSAFGTSRHFAAPQDLVAIGA